MSGGAVLVGDHARGASLPRRPSCECGRNRAGNVLSYLGWLRCDGWSLGSHSGRDPSLLLSLVEPYKASIGPSAGSMLLPDSIRELIQETQDARHVRMASQSRLPRRAEVMTRFNNFRAAESSSMAGLTGALDEIGALAVPRPADNPLIEKVELAVAGMKAGITTTANVFLGDLIHTKTIGTTKTANEFSSRAILRPWTTRQ